MNTPKSTPYFATLDILRFKIKRNLKLFNVSVSSMSGVELSEELTRLSQGVDVLEFGSGGSTILLSKSAKNVLSIESDKKFAHFMKKKLKDLGFHNSRVEYVDIGPTVRYGYPNPKNQMKEAHNYGKYVNRAFELVDQNNMQPKLVFIDGRFRVWCFISAILSLHQSFTIVVDDYFLRNQYSIMEEILGAPYKRISDAAFFRVEDVFRARSNITRASNVFQYDPE